jgi:DNA-binding CsgD family transcriptional regulator
MALDELRAFADHATHRLERSIAFDGVCVQTLDPATHVLTGEVADGVHTGPARARFEYGDVNTFRGLIRTGRRAASLSRATGGSLHRSARHRALRRGLGDELRAVLLSEATPWGALTLERTADRAPFTDADLARVAAMAGELAEDLRSATLHAALSVPPVTGEPGLVVLSPGDEIETTDRAGETHLAGAGALVVAAVAGCVHGGEPERARARVRTREGWLVVRGSALRDARTAITLEPAGERDLAPLIADAYGITERERAVTELVAAGLATAAIAQRLHVSPWTVQDHLKSIFEKTSVATRGELVARLFFAQRPPRLVSPPSPAPGPRRRCPALRA